MFRKKKHTVLVENDTLVVAHFLLAALSLGIKHKYIHTLVKSMTEEMRVMYIYCTDKVWKSLNAQAGDLFIEVEAK